MNMNMKPDFDKSDGLVPAVVQDFYSKEVLMLAYMNEEALEQTRESKKVTFYSRSKKRLWTKGETSGNFLNLKKIELDCDSDTLLIQVIPEGPACHLNNDTCFREDKIRNTDLGFLTELIAGRKKNPVEGSYTNKLLADRNFAAQKVGEEAIETIIEAKDNNKELFLNESADLLYHLLVLVENKDCHFNEVVEVLLDRFSDE